MAAASVAHRPTALESTTNSPPRSSYPKSFAFTTLSERSKPLRRIDSLRRIQQRSTGSDFDLPTPADSIYNAERVDSEEASPDEEQIFKLPPPVVPVVAPAHVPAQHQAESSTSNISKPFLIRSPPLGHSHWPEPQLDTILERTSTRSLRQSASAPRLQSSPERSSHFVKSQQSIHSIHPICSDRYPWPRQKPLPSTGIHHQYSFSMTDLDCIKRIIASKDEDDTPATLCSSSCSKPSTPMFPIRPTQATSCISQDSRRPTRVWEQRSTRTTVSPPKAATSISHDCTIVS